MGRRPVANPRPNTIQSRELRARWSDDQRRSWNLAARGRTYGLTSADILHQFDLQGGKCATCDAPLDVWNGRKSHIDHDHATGRVRGLVCQLCNIMLAAIDRDRALGREPMERLVRCVRYAERGGIFEPAQLELDIAS